MDNQLEQALLFAGIANDIASLKAIAWQENRRAEKFARLLSAVLEVTGPVRIRGDLFRRGEYHISAHQDGEDLVVGP